MKIQEITVTAGRTFNHPHEQYSNLRPDVTLRATLEDGEDPDKAAKWLQAKAEGLVEDHKNGLLKSIEELYQLSEINSSVASLEDELKRATSRLENLRKQRDGLLQLPEKAEAGNEVGDHL